MAYHALKKEKINKMKNLEIKNMWNNLQSCIVSFSISKDEINRLLLCYENIISSIIKDISEKENFSESNVLFDYLEVIQDQLCLVEFKYNFSVTKKLYDVISNLDRLDDISERQFWYTKFKEGKGWPVL